MKMKPEVKFSVELTYINTTATLYNEDNTIKKLGWIDIGFEITHSNGVIQYAPTTIMLTKGSLTDSEVIEQAAKEVIPGQIAMAYNYSLSQLEDESESESTE